ncbi:ribosomal protein L11 [Candidatus Carsonella ruddii CS isolate Thao2000]|uniref:Large ribosomal subunit protein uL11 n=1 Tax=Candidatus Carsonella ruddii CS isolate Thao2000 TaxID=1202537 RepID=J7GTH4_CARRU|nr:50S ribosomal protein L11 [Candidatus Carsonella ruddii]AFP83839.1 ribosomal protein L11 [Candidatus Carsonella ruddii CS isolate Thao2000]
MKKIKFKIKLFLIPGKATPAPPVGSILGQYGINLKEFCFKFNEITKNIKYDLINLKVIIYIDNTYDIILGTISLSNKIKIFLNIKKFSKKPGIEKLFLIKFNQINDLSYKRFYFEKKKISSIRKMILGTMISNGLYYE